MLNKLYDIEYINKFITDVYDIYGSERYGITVTYYSVDFEHSKNLDKNEYFDSGSYSDLIGNFSGWKWNKINFVPLFGFDSINGRTNIEEEGIHFRTNTSAKIASKIGIRPFFNDIIFVNEYTGDSLLGYIVTSIEGSGLGDKSDFNLSLNYFDIECDLINNHIVDEFIFIPFFRKIYQKDVALQLLNDIQNLESLNDEIMGYDNNVSGLNCIEI